MIVFLIIIAVIILLIAVYYLDKNLYRKKVLRMSTDDMFRTVTKKKGKYITVAAIEDGRITYNVYGDDDTKRLDFDYEIGSISKTMLALLVSKAIDEGKLKLSDSISEYLDLPKDKYYPTIERILTHTSGYKSFYMNSTFLKHIFSSGNPFNKINKEQLLKEAGAVTLKDKDYPFLYSNFAISIAGLVLEAVYHKDYVTLLNEYLHNDLNMKNSSVATGEGNLDKYWKWDKDDGYIPAGPVISNITDMAKYLQFMMTSDEEYVIRTLTSGKEVSTKGMTDIMMGIRINKVSLTWIHDTANHLIWHSGGTGAYNTYLAFNEDRTKGIVIMSNFGPGKSIPAVVIGAKIMSTK